MNTVSLDDQDYGQRLFHRLRKKHGDDVEDRRHQNAMAIFDHLLATAKVDSLPWQLHIFDAPNIVDVRAVHGNQVFVWSGLLDLAQTDSEVAGLLACEIAHVLARHTEPAKFNVFSDIFFEVSSVAATVGLLVASQGAVAIGGSGWLKALYVEAADLDPLDRKYDPKLEREAATIALVILQRSLYAPEALFQFWKRVVENSDLTPKTERLARGIPPEKRSAMLAELLPLLPTWVPKNETTPLVVLWRPTTYRNP
jgi:predicted Zn-dependent protease